MRSHLNDPLSLHSKIIHNIINDADFMGYD
jgi:hypothetical protein